MVSEGVRPSALFCGLQWPYFPGRSGGEIRDYHLVRALLETYRLRYFSVWDGPRGGREDPLRSRLDHWRTPDADERARARPGKIARILQHVRTKGWPVIGPRLPVDVAAHSSAVRALAPALRRTIAAAEPDLLLVSPQVNPVGRFLGSLPARTRMILGSYDVEAVRTERFAAASRGLARIAVQLDARRSEVFERENLARFDGVIAVSEVDAAIYRSRYGVLPERLVVIENGVDPEYFAFAPGNASPLSPNVVFAAAMGYPPNEDAAWRLVRHIMPRVRRSREARLTLVGQQPADGLRRQHDGEQTIVTGEVQDVRAYLAKASVACVPLRFGSGTKIKVLEAMSAGVPVVCSTVAAEGLGIVHEEHALIADSDEALAANINRVLGDPALAARLSATGRSLIEARYAWDRCLSPLLPWLDHIRSLPRGSSTGEPLAALRSTFTD